MNPGWKHKASRLPGAMGLRGGRIRALTALDGAGLWQSLRVPGLKESHGGALCQTLCCREQGGGSSIQGYAPASKDCEGMG